jgi:hypothetical protein
VLALAQMVSDSDFPNWVTCSSFFRIVAQHLSSYS